MCLWEEEEGSVIDLNKVRRSAQTKAERVREREKEEEEEDEELERGQPGGMEERKRDQAWQR
jgi:hypothetical protein